MQSLIFDGSLEGMFTIVHKYYYEKLRPADIVARGEFQPMLGAEYTEITTDREKAAVVAAAVVQKISEEAYRKINYAMLSDNRDHFIDVLHYIIDGFRIGREIEEYTHLPHVLSVHKMTRNVWYEAQRLKGFLRFSECKAGLLYAKFAPDNDILPILVEHFCERLINEGWIIHDMKRQKAAVYNGKELGIIPLAAELELGRSDNEEEIRRLWKAFHEAIGVSERENRKLQRGMLPLKYRKYMTEFHG